MLLCGQMNLSLFTTILGFNTTQNGYFHFYFECGHFGHHSWTKLDWVGPVDNRPSTDELHHFVKKKKCDMWHVTCDMWHLTCDTWHMTLNLFGGLNIFSKFQLPNSYRLWFMILWRSGGKGSLNEWMIELMNHEAVYRTALATPGLLITMLVLMSTLWNKLLQYLYLGFFLNRVVTTFIWSL